VKAKENYRRPAGNQSPSNVSQVAACWSRQQAFGKQVWLENITFHFSEGEALVCWELRERQDDYTAHLCRPRTALYGQGNASWKGCDRASSTGMTVRAPGSLPSRNRGVCVESMTSRANLYGYWAGIRKARKVIRIPSTTLLSCGSNLRMHRRNSLHAFSVCRSLRTSKTIQRRTLCYKPEGCLLFCMNLSESLDTQQRMKIGDVVRASVRKVNVGCRFSLVSLLRSVEFGAAELGVTASDDMRISAP